MIKMITASLLCLSVVCVSPELKKAVSVTAKYQKQYVEYANKKIADNPDDRSEEMIGIGTRLDRNVQKLDELVNGE